MLIPIGHEDQQVTRLPWVTILLVTANVVVFLLTNQAAERQAGETRQRIAGNRPLRERTSVPARPIRDPPRRPFRAPANRLGTRRRGPGTIPARRHVGRTQVGGEPQRLPDLRLHSGQAQPAGVVHLHVPARRMAAPPGQHAVPLARRRQLRRPLGAALLSRPLPRRRRGGSLDSRRHDPTELHAHGRGLRSHLPA